MKRIFLFAVLFWIFGGCSMRTIPTYSDVTYHQIKISDSKTKRLVERFVEYWHARTQGDMKKAWKFELPYQKFLSSFKKYKAEVGGYKGAKIELVGIRYEVPNIAIVTRKVRIGKNVMLKKDKWLYIKDTWYHKYYQTIFPPETMEEAEFQ